jgi:hypothetical protein
VSLSKEATEHASLIAKFQREHPEKSFQQAYVATLENNPALARKVLDASRECALAG